MNTDNDTTTNIATLAPVRVDGWILFTGEGSHWVRDLDLAERAGLKRPHDIRVTIQKAITDGALTISAAAGNGSGPPVRVEKELVTIGSGAAREVSVYYLSHEAALMVVMRLRTKAAVQLQIAISRVFLLAMQGRLEPSAPLPSATRPELAPQADSLALQRA